MPLVRGQPTRVTVWDHPYREGRGSPCGCGCVQAACMLGRGQDAQGTLRQLREVRGAEQECASVRGRVERRSCARDAGGAAEGMEEEG